MSRACGWLLLLAFCSGSASALDLGRLFFTPAERARLDAERSAPPAAAVDAPTGQAILPIETGPHEPPPAAEPLTVNGLVLRAHGPSTAWVNGTPGTRGELAHDDGRRLRIARDAVELSEQQTRARVKPGQTYDPLAGRVVEGFERAPSAAPAAP